MPTVVASGNDVSPQVSATFRDANHLSFSVNRTFFETVVGPTGFFNVLVGGFDTSQVGDPNFRATDVAIEDDSADFDTTIF